MDWKQIKEQIYFEDGSFRDIVIENTTRDDWRKWVDYVCTNYRVETLYNETQITSNGIDFDYVLDFWDGRIECNACSSVFSLDKIQVNAFYFDDLELENDIDPREVKAEEDHQAIVKYLKDLSIILDKKVVLILENCKNIILMTAENGQVTPMPFRG